ncbi:MAG: T9SS type A sorting domain-containing protein [Chitinophagaceae bacterium]|nr:T9SS type A sorting domain-containing protein [Chitinophagaceae bacterium]
MNYRIIHIRVIEVSRLTSYVSLILFLFLQFIGIQGYGQTFDSLAVDGRIFVKIKDTSSVYFQNYTGNDSTLRPEILPLKNTYGITKISKPFSNYNYNFCQKTYLFEFTSDSLIQGLINNLVAIGYIEYAEKEPIVFTFLTPIDGQFNGGILNSQNWHLKRIGAEQAWDISTGNASTVIAVIDNEIDINHPDLVNKVVSPSDQADNDNDPSPNATLNHGSHCAGLVAAESNNNFMNSGSIASIGYNCSIMPIKATSSSPQTLVNSLDIVACINGINYAVTNGANIINCSWGIFSPNSVPLTLQNACLNATSNGVLIVAAAGNNGLGLTPPSFPTIAFPAGFSTTNNGVISVGATNNNDAKAGFSFYGPSVNVCAPGENIFSTNSLQQITTIPGFDYKSGTSMAAPIVAGLCGLIHSINPSLTPSQIRDCITNTATNIDAINPQFAGFIGSGRINAPQALLCASNTQNTTASIIAGTTTACPNQQITLIGLPVGANSYNWSFSQAPTIVSQNGNQIVVTFPNIGLVNVTLTVNTASGVITANTSITIGNPFVDFDQRASGDICNGSAQQIDLNFFNTTPPFNYTITNGVTTTTISNLTTLIQPYFFNADMGNSNYTLTVTDVNGCNAQSTFSINNIVSCCQNLIFNGDFEQGNIGFTSDNVFSNCPLPVGICAYGTYQVIDLNNSVLPNTFFCNNPGMGVSPGQAGISIGAYNSLRNTMLRIEGRCGPDQTPIGMTNLAPLPNNTAATNGYQMGVSSILWRQNNISVNSNNSYNLDFFMSTLGGSNIFPNMINIQIIEQTTNNILFTSNNFVLPSTNHWNQYSFQFQPNINGNVIIQINQVEFFGSSYYDMNIDDISLRNTTNGFLNLNITNNCTPNAIISPITNILNPVYLFNGVSAIPPFNGIPGLNTVSIINDLGCVLTQTASISTTLPTLSPTCSPSTVCLGNTTSLICQGNFYYSWSNNVPNNTTITPATTTIFTVTATDINGCTQTATCSVTVNPLPNITANASSLNLCNGDFLTLTGTGGNLYNWSGGILDGIAFIPPLGVTTYTVTGTDANNCTATSTVTVDVSSVTIAASAALTTICPGQSSTLTATGATTYDWQPGGFAGSSVTVSPSMTTTYTVTGTNAFNCTATTTVTVNVLPPTSTACLCPNMPVQTFINPDASDILSFFNSPNNIIAGQIFGIDGTLTINTDITFIACHLLMGPDAEIILQTPNTLRIDDASVVETPLGCPMWKGIYSSVPNSSVKIISSELRDMQDGIVINANSVIQPNLEMFEADLINNYIGVQLFGSVSNAISIISSTFEKTLSPLYLKPPYQYLNRGFRGVVIHDAVSMDIHGNTFRNLSTGILLNQNLSTTTSNVNLSGNFFENIKGGTTLWPNPANPNPPVPVASDPNGCAIFAENQNSFHNPMLVCVGANLSGLWDFNDCQKAIITNGFSTLIELNKCLNVDGGILQYNTENKTQSVLNNQIQNTYLGIGVWGNSGGGGVSNNTIHVKAYPYVINPNYGSHFWGKGIELGYFSNAQNAWMAANNNIINSDEPEWIIGLNVYNSPSGPRLNNTIHFNSSSAVLNTNFVLPALRGVSLINSINNRFQNNIVEGTFQSSNPNRRSTGFWIYKSPRNYYACNTMDKTRYGMYVVGNNATGSPYHVLGNQFNPTFSNQAKHHVGLVFRHLATEATFGNIGDLQHDNHNTFGPLSAYTGGYKVFKFCSSQLPDQIFTNPLTLAPSESGSTNGCGYGVDPNYATHNQYDCTIGQFVPVKKFTLAEALDIAEDSVFYPEYQPVAEWMDENELYHQLLHDTAMRYSHPSLLQFFNQQHQDATRYIAETNDLIEALVQDISGMSAQDYQALLDDAEQRNASIQSPDVQEQHEYEINRIYLRYLRYGSDSLSAADAALIEDLATQCPYIGGTAVFKARSLFALYQPGFYIDDMAVCNAAGVYKNGKGLFDEENELLNNLVGQGQKTDSEQNEVWVYPNPTQGVVTISSRQVFNEARWIFKDMTGRSIAEGILPDKALNQRITLPFVSSGVYQLQVETKGKLYVNKLIVE